MNPAASCTVGSAESAHTIEGGGEKGRKVKEALNQLDSQSGADTSVEPVLLTFPYTYMHACSTANTYMLHMCMCVYVCVFMYVQYVHLYVCVSCS